MIHLSLLFKGDEYFIKNIKKIHSCIPKNMSVNNDSLDLTKANNLESFSFKSKDKISIEMSNYFKYIYKWFRTTIRDWKKLD